MRSTPIPSVTLRTVNVVRGPDPRRLITIPWKTCARSLSPSITRTCTRTVSPGRNSGTSGRACRASNFSRSFIGRSLLFLLRPLALPLRETPAVLGGQLRPTQEVGAPLECAAQRLVAPIARDLPVVSRKEHVRHPVSSEVRGPGVVGAVEETGMEGIALGGVEVAQNTRKEPRHGVEDAQGRGLTPAQHEISNRELFVGEVETDPLVHPFIAAAD